MKRILLVDDDKPEFMYVNFLLKDLYKDNYRLDYASNIKEAQTVLSTKGVDIILLDDKLGAGQTSSDTIPMLKQRAFNVPIVIISKDTSAKHLKERARLGTNKVVDKFELKKELAKGLLD